MIAGDFRLWGIDHVLRDLGMSDKCYGWGGWLDCVIFLHGFKEDEEGDWEPDDSPYVVDGRTYRRSGAHYGIAFDSQRGGQCKIVSSANRHSPQDSHNGARSGFASVSGQISQPSRAG